MHLSSCAKLNSYPQNIVKKNTWCAPVSWYVPSNIYKKRIFSTHLTKNVFKKFLSVQKKMARSLWLIFNHVWRNANFKSFSDVIFNFFWLSWLLHAFKMQETSSFFTKFCIFFADHGPGNKISTEMDVILQNWFNLPFTHPFQNWYIIDHF